MKMSEEHKRKIGDATRKNRKILKWASYGMKGKHQKQEVKDKLSNFWKGKKKKPFSLEHRKKISEALRRRVITNQTRIKMSNSHRGSKSYLWKGGITPINKAIRSSLEYKLWRKSVFERDSYTCIWCKRKGGRLHADHIKPFALYPELRFSIDNGRTLCIECHKTTDTFGGKFNRILTSDYLIEKE